MKKSKWIAPIIFAMAMWAVFVISCSDSDSSSSFVNIQGETSYCTEEELALRESPCSVFKDPDEWSLQYPSGSADSGMYSHAVTEDYKSKYFSKYTDKDGVSWIRFSLDASDQGKSANGSSVRTELRSGTNWQMIGKNSLSYTFYLTTTDFTEARFTVGQFLQYCDIKQSPLVRIEISAGRITAVVNDYEKDGITKANPTSRYDLGSISQYQVVSLKIAMDNKTLSLYRDNKFMAEHVFPDEVEGEYYNYFKAGIYYQNKNSPKIFSEIFMKDIEVEIESKNIDDSSSSSGEQSIGKFVFVEGTAINGTETLAPESEIFISGRTFEISDFYMCDQEVTQAEYKTYCKYGSDKPSSFFGLGSNYPAYCVSWYDAIVYCNLRSMAEGLTPCYKIGDSTDVTTWDGVVSRDEKYRGPSSSNETWEAVNCDFTANGYRLPTEAEWEYAARNRNRDSYTYAGSDTVGDVAWCDENSDDSTHEVKKKAPNGLGLYDMSGNVQEWCWDWYGSISSGTPDSGSASGSCRVLRGGSCEGIDIDKTVAFRAPCGTPSDRSDTFGFRVVRSAN